MAMMPEIRSGVESINFSIAGRLDEVAQIFEEQGANVFRVGAVNESFAVVKRNVCNGPNCVPRSRMVLAFEREIPAAIKQPAL